MAANTIQIKFRKDSRTSPISITVDLDELISTTKKREAKALEKLFDPSKELDQNQSLKFMAFGRVLEDNKKWSDYKKAVLDLLKITDSSIMLSVQTNVQQETKKSASEDAKKISASSAPLSSNHDNPPVAEQTTKADTTSTPKDPFGVQPSQSDNLYLFHSKKEEKKPLPDNGKENEEGLSEDLSIVNVFTPKRKSSCNIM